MILYVIKFKQTRAGTIRCQFIRRVAKRAIADRKAATPDAFAQLIAQQGQLFDPGIKIIAHPECPPNVLDEADFSGSTSAMINWVKDNQPAKVTMVTECSMSDNVAVENPNVEFIRPCNLCPHMKRITLPKILESLVELRDEVTVDPLVADRARQAVERMVNLKS